MLLVAPLQKAWELTGVLLPELCSSQSTDKHEFSSILRAVQANFQRSRLLFVLMFIANQSAIRTGDSCFVSERSSGPEGQNLSVIFAVQSLGT